MSYTKFHLRSIEDVAPIVKYITTYHSKNIKWWVDDTKEKLQMWMDLPSYEQEDVDAIISAWYSPLKSWSSVDQLIAQAAQAHTYFDGTTHYEIDNCYEDADDNGNPCFRVLDPRTSEDYLIAFCDIPAEAYFMKLVRI